jgi:MarR family 2-MHQ and catechol resistance regulon transcriptional repressor
MTDITAKNAANQEFMPLLRELVRAYQAFAAYDAAGFRDTELTPPQADVLFTLGNTEGLTFKEIGELTLITKGTLTGIIDRMQEKGLVKRVTLSNDRRCTRVVLTAKGIKLFNREFPRQINYVKQRFDRLTEAEQDTALQTLKKIREIFS